MARSSCSLSVLTILALSIGSLVLIISVLCYPLNSKPVLSTWPSGTRNQDDAAIPPSSAWEAEIDSYDEASSPRRRLSPSELHESDTDLEHVLSLATRSVEDSFTEGSGLRVLFIVTTLAEYDKGTRGTKRGDDRLAEIVLPLLVDGAKSMVERGWDVDVYLICGFETLREERRKMISDALPDGVGFEAWEDATPFYYKKNFKGQMNKPDQAIEIAPHGLSRQHRFVVRDKLMEYDFFMAFEDDMRITADHAVNFLEMSVEIDRLRKEAEASPDGKVYVPNAPEDRRKSRGKSMDKASVGNDVASDPMTAQDLRRLWPGFVRAEVLDQSRFADNSHPLIQGDHSSLEHFKWKSEVPPLMDYESQVGTIDPDVCCGVPPGRVRTPPNPSKEDLLMWETDISAMGVRLYPGNIGWAAAMTVEDQADIGSFWSGEPAAGEKHIYDPGMKRPRRVNSLIGQQAGWMATRSQILYFHEHACPGGFLPPFDGPDWFEDSLQTKNGAVEFWSGGYQMFGRCYFNRILSMDPKRFSRQLLYHTSNNKQRTVNSHKFVRLEQFLGQLYRVKERAEKALRS